MTLQQAPFLREQRQFPSEDIKSLANQVDQAYIDIALKVNARIVGTFAVGNALITGESWFLSGQPRRQQTLRQVFTFTGAGNLPHGINFASVSSFTRGFGSYTDGTNWYGVLFASSVAIAGQVSFYVTPTNVVVLVDGAAPAPTTGLLVIEWLSNF